jgi:hypothetical protein
MTWIQAASGTKIILDDPDNTPIYLHDISASLSRICRFNGHLKRAALYSVAQHSVLVSDHCEDPKAGLLHDAAEAYLGDVVGPLKELLPEYKVLEDLWQRRIERAFQLPVGALSTEAVKRADRQALATEARDLICNGAGRDVMMARVVQWSGQIYAMPQAEAEAAFLHRATRLGAYGD